LIILFAEYIVSSALAAAIFIRYWGNGDFFPDVFYPFFALVVFAAIVVYPGKYVPIKNKHESLLNKYGTAYLTEAERAISKIGVSRMLRTSWFEIYAKELCEKEASSDT